MCGPPTTGRFSVPLAPLSTQGKKPPTLMPTEYYDQNPGHDPDEPTHNPTKREQDAYWLFRSQISAALYRNWPQVLIAIPEVAAANENMVEYLTKRPNHRFNTVRPEDLRLTTQGRESIRTYLR